MSFNTKFNGKQKFGFRKLSVGLAAVALSTTFFLSNSQLVHADTNTATNEEQTQQDSQKSNQEQSNNTIQSTQADPSNQNNQSSAKDSPNQEKQNNKQSKLPLFIQMKKVTTLPK